MATAGSIPREVPTLRRRVLAEFAGTATLVATVVGSGVMGTNLSKDAAVALIANALATVAALGLLIWMIGPVSGAHFNPVVSVVAVVRELFRPRQPRPTSRRRWRSDRRRHPRKRDV